MIYVHASSSEVSCIYPRTDSVNTLQPATYSQSQFLAVFLECVLDLDMPIQGVQWFCTFQQQFWISDSKLDETKITFWFENECQTKFFFPPIQYILLLVLYPWKTCCRRNSFFFIQHADVTLPVYCNPYCIVTCYFVAYVRMSRKLCSTSVDHLLFWIPLWDVYKALHIRLISTYEELMLVEHHCFCSIDHKTERFSSFISDFSRTKFQNS